LKLYTTSYIRNLRFMSSNRTQATTVITMARGGMEHKEEIRTRVVRVRQETYDRLRGRGEMGMDFDDVITRLLDQTEKTKGQK
jgi:hypothetical protein